MHKPVVQEPSDEREALVDIRQVLHRIWDVRGPVLVVSLVAATLSLIVGTVVFFASPVEHTASLEFQPVFAGASKREYPNGLPFSTSDIVAKPVLLSVFDKNDLGRFLPFEEFENSVSVVWSNVELDLLDAEYRAQLSDSRLVAPDRAKLESDYREKRGSLFTPQMRVMFASAGRLSAIPPAVMQKTLSDILAGWAEDIASKRGVLLHQVGMLTSNELLKDTLQTQTTLIRYDILRRHVSRTIAQIDRVSALPGSTNIRVGANQVSLLDLKTSLEDLREFQLDPLIRRRLAYSISSAEMALNRLYVEDRIAELERVRLAGVNRQEQLQQAIASFTPDPPSPVESGTNVAAGPTVAPQMSDSFLDKLLDLAGRSGALDYRKELTDRLIAANEEGLSVVLDLEFYRETLRLLGSAARGSQAVALKPADVESAFQEYQNRVLTVLDLTNEAYRTISDQNLNPRGLTYRLTGAYSVETLRAVTATRLVVIGLALVALAALLTAGGLILWSSWKDDPVLLHS